MGGSNEALVRMTRNRARVVLSLSFGGRRLDVGHGIYCRRSDRLLLLWVEELFPPVDDVSLTDELSMLSSSPTPAIYGFGTPSPPTYTHTVRFLQRLLRWDQRRRLAAITYQARNGLPGTNVFTSRRPQGTGAFA